MKKILVPTDFSEQAENALHVAAQLARKHDAEIYLLHLLELPLYQVDALSTHSDLPEAVFFMKLAHKRFK
ncbi:MAG: universal stress protein, partial [Bacteroidia bacterium]|nr:universal stress protein [Bacteroidia bacterium]